MPTILIPSEGMNGGHAIGRALARPVDFAHPTVPAHDPDTTRNERLAKYDADEEEPVEMKIDLDMKEAANRGGP